jgi:hypothetical protein
MLSDEPSRQMMNQAHKAHGKLISILLTCSFCADSKKFTVEGPVSLTAGMITLNVNGIVFS